MHREEADFFELPARDYALTVCRCNIRGRLKTSVILNPSSLCYETYRFNFYEKNHVVNPSPLHLPCFICHEYYAFTLRFLLDFKNSLIFIHCPIRSFTWTLCLQSQLSVLVPNKVIFLNSPKN